MFIFRQVLNLPHTMEPAAAHWIGGRETPPWGCRPMGTLCDDARMPGRLGEAIAPGSSSSGRVTSDSRWRYEA